MWCWVDWIGHHDGMKCRDMAWYMMGLAARKSEQRRNSAELRARGVCGLERIGVWNSIVVGKPASLGVEDCGPADH